ncbi:MAG: NAD(P)/FAD-dependent oxidoreductase [Candidatus Binatus sp.]|uniref:NAD(P)/FAD-dependent oxidoreductase n=1 Tax=Candidatus Binatus sp. TaxID=2811406 RepID=UPI0027228779|nr:NAD(P)/FAD-dependent oxidoreductase [Candidatus Binatus sp.]MDO8431892.1 NAD(P)/FAD-dependent oxidoreductase [Candidatus Binatus sp.]
MPANFDVVVIGAGAAGLMCAITAAQRGRCVLLLEHNDQAGAKILISGGGRCNFTNLEVAPERFLSANPHFCKSALSRYTQRDFITMVERHRIPYHEKTLGQLFCDRSARDILAMLLDESAAAGVDLRVKHRVTSITRSDRFRIDTGQGTFTARALVLATGGLSIPKMGATDFAYETARRFDLPVIEPRPGLVPLRFSGTTLDLCRELTGVSADAIVSCGRTSFRESILFTHRGLSGPAILQISSYWREGESIAIDLVPPLDAHSFLKDRKRTRPKAELKTVLAEMLPARLASAISDAVPHEGPIANLPDRHLTSVAARLKRWSVTPVGTEGWPKAEVTVGGIDTDALSSKTMEARTVPGLFIIGEAVDVTGWLGGYNFQWAWSSGWVAGQAI